MNDLVKRCLEDLEERLDPAEEERILAEWLAFTEGRFSGGIFTPQRSRPNPARVEWPKVGVNPALEDYDAMILQQFGAVSAMLEGAGGAMLNVRSNYGSSIAPLLFGVEVFLMDEDLELNTLPTSVPLNDADAVRRLVDAGIPDLQTGFGGRVLEMGQRFAEIACLYPKIGRYVVIYHPDLQGPMDICEVVWGATMFLALYEQPDLVKAFLELATQTYTAFLNEWLRTVPFRPYANVHWGLMHRGNIMLRDDSAMNLSPAMFDEFVRPYDQRLLRTLAAGPSTFAVGAITISPVCAAWKGCTPSPCHSLTITTWSRSTGRPWTAGSCCWGCSAPRRSAPWLPGATSTATYTAPSRPVRADTCSKVCPTAGTGVAALPGAGHRFSV